LSNAFINYVGTKQYFSRTTQSQFATMEQYHRILINNRMSDLVYVTSNLETILEKLLEKNVINEWMKKFILVRNLN